MEVTKELEYIRKKDPGMKQIGNDELRFSEIIYNTAYDATNSPNANTNEQYNYYGCHNSNIMKINFGTNAFPFPNVSFKSLCA